ncbi:MAG: glycosyl hydrolase 53 family protein [Bacteroidales bacterium]|nr:glycosyl hydrolase 53 family protein [Bacteroidales bacterium]
MKFQITLVLFLIHSVSYSQQFYFGSDLSYTNMMEDCGAVFKEDNAPKEVYRIFSDNGFNLARFRLWYEPTWQNSLVQPGGVKSQYHDFEDVKEGISRAKAAGMQVMLDIHFSNFWTDPAKQIIPPAWVGVATNITALKDSVYNYVTKVLTALNSDSLMPEIVKIGNENNSGILRHTTLTSTYTASGSVSSDWSRHAQLYNIAIKAVRDVSLTTSIKPKISLHYAGTSSLSWWYQNIISNGVTDFDIIGFSYYYAWHSGSITNLGNVINTMKTSFPGYEVMVVETGYLWSSQNYDALGNIITTPDPQYLPVIPEKQREYMVDMTREVMKAGGTGIIFWEPAWVSTPCRTPWGQGSSQEHVAFFEVDNYNFMANGAGTWPLSEHFSDLTTHKVTFKVDMTGTEAPNGAWITGTFTGTDWQILPMVSEGNNIFSFTTYLHAGDSGAYYFLNDSSWTARETVPAACAAWWNTDRGYKIGETNVVYTSKWGTCDPIGPPSEVNVTFKVDMTGQDVSNNVWITGSFTGSSWKILRMSPEANNIFSYTTKMHPGDSGAFYFMNDDVWGKRESVPSACAPWWGSDRGYKIGEKDTTYGFLWGSCLGLGEYNPVEDKFVSTRHELRVFPNPCNGMLNINYRSSGEPIRLEIFNLNGKILKSIFPDPLLDGITLDIHELLPGIYFLRLSHGKELIYRKIVRCE